MHPAYFETHFRVANLQNDWRAEFCIISAYATTGEHWPIGRSEAADRELEADLRGRSVWLKRVTGYSPSTKHAEPSWAAEIPFEQACDIGLKYHQDAIYHVARDVLSVSKCDINRSLFPFGKFRERLSLEGSSM